LHKLWRIIRDNRF